jgi:hypothetical protein
MPEPQPDVNNPPVPSTEEGVPAAPPAAAPDVNPLSVPSAEATPAAPAPEKTHEESVPYDRFNEVIAQNNQLKADLEAAIAAASAPAEAPPAEPVDWNALGLAPPAQEAPPNNGAVLPDEVEERLREDMYQRPYQTMAPIIQELARQVIKQERQQESQVRRMPDFQNYESSYYNVPDDLVMQTQGNPEVIRYLIAKHQATLRGTPPPPMPASMQNQAAPTQIPSAAPIAAPAVPKTMDELRAQYMAEGERLAMEKMRNQSGLISESATTIPAQQTDEPELDDYGKNFMRNLGIPEEKFGSVAKRMAKG